MKGSETLQAIAYVAFVYAYPMMEQVKALHGVCDYRGDNYLCRAFGADFGLWGNGKEEANHSMTRVAGEG